MEGEKQQAEARVVSSFVLSFLDFGSWIWRVGQPSRAPTRDTTRVQVKVSRVTLMPRCCWRCFAAFWITVHGSVPFKPLPSSLTCAAAS